MITRKPLIFDSDEDVLPVDPTTLPPYRPPQVSATQLALVQPAPAPPVLVTDSTVLNEDAPPAAPQRITGSAAAQMDREFDIKEALRNLNKQRDTDKIAMQALVYELHELMSGTGRDGKFTTFLRDELGWSEKYAYTKAMRWKAAHEYRVGMIDEATYRKRMGNGSTTSRSASEQDPAPATSVPTLSQTFTIEDDPSAPALDQPTFSPEDISADVAALEERKAGFYKTVLMRAMYPTAVVRWFHAAWRTQAQRHGTKTFKDTLIAVLFLGTKWAEPGDEWEEFWDEVLQSIGRDPASALRPEWIHPDDRDDPEADPSPAPVAVSPEDAACAAETLLDEADELERLFHDYDDQLS